jgi:predicted secreted protein
MFVRLPAPLDFAIEDVAVIAALLGAIIVGVFYALIRTSSSGKAAGAHA